MTGVTLSKEYHSVSLMCTSVYLPSLLLCMVKIKSKNKLNETETLSIHVTKSPKFLSQKLKAVQLRYATQTIFHAGTFH